MIAQCGIENERKGFVFDGRTLPFLFAHHDWQTVYLVIVQLMMMLLMMLMMIMLFLLTAEGERTQLRSRSHSFNSIISIIAAATTGTCSKSWRIDRHFIIRILRIIIIIVRVIVVVVAYEG